MKAVIVCFLFLLVISCLAENNESWKSEVVVSAKEVRRPMKGVLGFLDPLASHVGIVVTTNAGRSHLIHNIRTDDEKDVLSFVFGGFWTPVKSGVVVSTDWKMPQEWRSQEITPVKQGITVEQVFNAMWGGNYQKAIGNGSYGLSNRAGICSTAAMYGKNAITGKCSVKSGDCRQDYTYSFIPFLKWTRRPTGFTSSDHQHDDTHFYPPMSDQRPLTTTVVA